MIPVESQNYNNYGQSLHPNTNHHPNDTRIH